MLFKKIKNRIINIRVPQEKEIPKKYYKVDHDYMDKIFEFREYYLFKKLQHSGSLQMSLEITKILNIDDISIYHKKFTIYPYDDNYKFKLINKNNKISFWFREDLVNFICAFPEDWKIYDSNNNLLFPKNC